MTKLMKMIVAMGLGYLVGVLMAPKSGAENREKLKSKANDLRDITQEKIQRVTDALKDATQDVKNETKDLKIAAKKESGLSDSL